MRDGLPALSVIIVNYNAGDLLADSVAAVLASPVSLEVVVSDNGSDDDSLRPVRERSREDKRLKFLENGANLGFSRGNNLALVYTSAPYILFLNPDCILNPGTLPPMIDFMDATPEAGMAGCVIRNPDGSEQVASRRVIPDPWIGLVRLLRLERLWPSLVASKRLNLTDEPLPDAPIPVDAISGSFMLVRRRALEQVGPLDEGYFLHCEDLDWFVRFQRSGWAIYLVPYAEVVHHKGACSTGHPIAVEWHKHRGMTRFFRKFQFSEHTLPFSVLVVTGIWVHFAFFLAASALRRLFRVDAVK